MKKKIFSEMQAVAIGLMGMNGEIRPHDLLIEWGKIKDVSTWRSSRAQFGLNSSVHKCLYNLETRGICSMKKPDGFTLVFQLIPGAGSEVEKDEIFRIVSNAKIETLGDGDDGGVFVVTDGETVVTFDLAVAGTDKTITTVHMSTKNGFVGVNAAEATEALKWLATAFQNFTQSANQLSHLLAIDSRRRYYLHRKIKKFCKVKARQKMVFITQPVHDALKKSQMKDITELINGGYSVQIEIPD